MTDMKIGSYYKYLIVDVTKEAWAPGPNSVTPIYLGLGPSLPADTFTALNGKVAFQVLELLVEGHPLNPFPCPILMATRVK